MGDLPADCRKKEKPAGYKLGDLIAPVLRRDEDIIARQNARVDRCAAHWDRTKRSLEG